MCMLVFQPIPSLKHEPDFYDTVFEPATLAAISSHIALFPANSPGADPSYPPSQANSTNRDTSIGKYPSFTFPGGGAGKSTFRTLQAKKKPQVKIREKTEENGEEDSSSNKFGKVENYVTIKRSLTRRPSFRPVDFACKRQNEVSVKPHEMPLSSEAVYALSSLCFPGELRTSDHVETYRPAYSPNKHHTLISLFV